MIALPGSFKRSVSLQSLRGEDEALFWNLSARWRDYILAYFEIFNELARARNIKAACVELAERNAHLGRGFSAKTIGNLHRAYRRTGDWKILLKDYKGPKDPQPVKFIQELQKRVEENNRCALRAFKTLRRDWAGGVSIPGYGTWRDLWAAKYNEPAPEFFPDDFFPAGWDDRNLYRYCPSEAETGLARDGYHATHHLMPQIERTTAGLRPLEGVVFDDVRTDWLVIVPGYTEPVELWLLVAMDLSTRRILNWCAKAIVRDEDSGKKQHILRSEMRMLAGSILKDYGIPQGYVSRWVVENEKATLGDADVSTLRLITGDAVQARFSGMSHKTALPGGYQETHGQPWFKAALESFFNLFHNELAALPGQTGASYASAPGELDGRKKAAKALLKAAAEVDLPAALIAQLKAPFLLYHEAIDAITQVMKVVNERVEHELEGFEEIAEFRFSVAERYRPIAELARYPKDEIRRALIRHRKESPQERWFRLVRGETFTPVSDLAVLPFIAKTIPEVQVFKPFHVRIGGRVYRAEHERLRYERREVFTARVLESDPSLAYIFDAEDRHVTAVRCTEKVGWFDEAAQERAFGEQKHYAALIEEPLRERHADKEAARERADAHNQAILEAHRTGAAMVDSAQTVRVQAKRQSAAQLRKNTDRAAQLAARAKATQAEPI